jgi:hypothetical protein
MKGIHPNGKATFAAGAAIAAGEFVKFSSGKVVKAAAEGDLVPVQLLSSGDTALVKAGGAVAQGGTVSCLGTTVATAGTLQYGIALEAATASGQLIECIVGLPAVLAIS